MRTEDDIKQLIADYQAVIQNPDETKDKFVVKVDNMTLNKSENGRYIVSKVDWPSIFNKELAKARIKTFSAKFTLMNFQLTPYNIWLKSEVEKLNKIANSIPDPDPETPMEAFKDIDNPQPIQSEQTTQPKIVTEQTSEEIITIITNPNCVVGCNNCLCCKWLTDVIHIEDKGILKIKCKHPLKINL